MHGTSLRIIALIKLLRSEAAFHLSVTGPSHSADILHVDGWERSGLEMIGGPLRPLSAWLTVSERLCDECVVFEREMLRSSSKDELSARLSDETFKTSAPLSRD